MGFLPGGPEVCVILIILVLLVLALCLPAMLFGVVISRCASTPLPAEEVTAYELSKLRYRK